MSRKRWSRRAMLSGLGLGAIAPFVPLLHGSAEETGFPKRLIIVYTPSGVPLQEWRCTGSEADFQLSPILAPLEPFKDRLLVLDGLDVAAAYHSASSGQNHKSIVAFWTGHELLPGNDLDPGEGSESGWPAGPSVDQVVANAVGDATYLPSIELGVQNRHKLSRQQMIHGGPSQPIPIEPDPYKAFDRVFGELDLNPVEAERLRTQRRAIVDTVYADLTSLQNRVGGDDRRKIEAHMDNLATLGDRLSSLVVCTDPMLPDGVDTNPSNSAAAPAIGDLQTDIIVQALACDVTRVASLLWTNESSNLAMSWLGHNTPHHTLSHYKNADDVAAARSQYADYCTWFSTQFAELLGKLDAVPEGDGTLLDNTAVVWGSAMGRAGPHSQRNVPVVVAGSCGGHFRTGRYLRWGSYDEDSPAHKPHGGRSISDLYLSLCHAMGLNEMSTFGDPQYCDGPLDGLT